ncbi:MAG: phage tail protein [Anaerolineales bacterium]|nr:phage tail protein [Anaerolineales bacterium]
MRKNRVYLSLLIIFTLPIIIFGIVCLSRKSSDDPCRWNFFRAFPLKWEGPAVTVSNSEIHGIKQAQENVELDLDGTTPTATLEVVPTSSPTLDFVSAIADQNANCRYGPSTIFHVIGYLQRGEDALVHAMSRMGDWYLVSIQSSGIFCWVWKDLLVVNGDINTLPVNLGPPQPTEIVPEPREHTKKAGCWVVNDPQYPNGKCKPAPCGPNDFPGTPCDLP